MQLWLLKLSYLNCMSRNGQCFAYKYLAAILFCTACSITVSVFKELIESSYNEPWVCDSIQGVCLYYCIGVRYYSVTGFAELVLPPGMCPVTAARDCCAGGDRGAEYHRKNKWLSKKAIIIFSRFVGDWEERSKVIRTQEKKGASERQWKRWGERGGAWPLCSWTTAPIWHNYSHPKRMEIFLLISPSKQVF